MEEHEKDLEDVPDMNKKNSIIESGEAMDQLITIDGEERITSHNEFEPVPLTNNLNADELDPETTAKLRGDAIGDTLYSQSFVLKTLLKFADLNWNQQFEEDLCFLWDMTAEKSVCEYLWELSFPSVACSAVAKYTENRFIEIVIGTLANVLCVGCDKTMTKEEIGVIIQELDSDDHLVLIQVMRFISSVAFSSSETPFIDEEAMNRLCFVLNNSINTELLLKTLETTAKLTVDFKLDKNLVNSSLYNAVLTAYCTLLGSAYLELDTKDGILACRYMLENVTNICGYIDRFENATLKLDITGNLDGFLQEAIKIIKYLSQEENLLPVTDDTIFFMSAFQYIFINLNVNYSPEIFIAISKILYIVSEIRNDVERLFESTLELECFLISRSTKQRIFKDLKLLSKHKRKTVLDVVLENGPKFHFAFDLKDLKDEVT
nr:uncharacterized protein LOC111517287 [Leptinotarsa decemlineata]